MDSSRLKPSKYGTVPEKLRLIRQQMLRMGYTETEVEDRISRLNSNERSGLVRKALGLCIYCAEPAVNRTFCERHRRNANARASANQKAKRDQRREFYRQNPHLKPTRRQSENRQYRPSKRFGTVEEQMRRVIEIFQQQGMELEGAKLRASLISRQRRHQILLQSIGLCMLCGKPAVTSTKCEEHRVKELKKAWGEKGGTRRYSTKLTRARA